MTSVLAATGHRPDKLGGYGAQQEAKLRAFARQFLEANPLACYGVSGMALGWDTAWAQALSDLRIPWTAAVPFLGQESRWPEHSRREYDRLLALATHVEIVSPGGYSRAAMQARNDWMRDHCDTMVALWNGSPGGTANCVRSCQADGTPVVNLWPGWAACNGGSA